MACDEGSEEGDLPSSDFLNQFMVVRVVVNVGVS